MVENDREYQLRCLISSLLEYFEGLTEDYDEFCDCSCTEGKHKGNCQTINVRKDMLNFDKRFHNILYGK